MWLVGPPRVIAAGVCVMCCAPLFASFPQPPPHIADSACRFGAQERIGGGKSIQLKRSDRADEEDMRVEWSGYDVHPKWGLALHVLLFVIDQNANYR